MKNDMFQQIDYQCKVLAYVVRYGKLPDETIFITPDECNQQVGYIVREGGDEVPRHVHKQIKREIIGTTEVLYIMSGRCEVDFYDDNLNKVATHLLETGDLIVIVAGGHGFRMLEKTVMLEVKQGPYPGLVEKERF